MTPLLTLVLLTAAGPSSDAELALARGEVVFDESRHVDGTLIIEARAILSARPEDVLALVDDCGGYARTLPKVAESRELARTGSTARCYSRADLPFPLPDRESVNEATVTRTDAVTKRTWRQIEGDYKKNSGFWELTPVDDGARTLVRYRCEVDIGWPLPESLAANGQRDYVVEMFTVMRTHLARRERAGGEQRAR